MAYLEISGLRGGYGSLPVLHDLEMSVEEGETAVLLGSNGAGKTTTMLHIAGMMKPWAGDIVFNGQSIAGKDASFLVASGVALVPEGRRVFAGLTVTKNLQMGGWVHRKNAALVKEKTEQVFDYFPRLKERASQLGGTLSGGEQQMLAIGRGLMADPKLLMIDEASLGLSPVLTQTVFDIVRRINADGVTVILVEQNVSAVAFADRTFVMEKGRIVFTGAGDEILESAEIREAYLGTPA